MADKNWEDQHNTGPYGYRHRYGGGYYEDHNRGGRRGGGEAYGRNEEEGYTQDIGRQHTDMQGNRSQLITGARGSDYARAYGGGESERYNAGTGYGRLCKKGLLNKGTQPEGSVQVILALHQ